MKRKLIITIVLLVMSLVGVLYGVHRFFNGAPTLKQESKEIVADYLQNNYPEQAFKVESVAYYPGEGTYIVHIVSNDGKIEGNIDVRNGKVVGTELGDFPPEKYSPKNKSR
jgi:hypothetical protein